MPVSFNATFKESSNHDATFAENARAVSADFEASVAIGGILPSDELPLMDGKAQAGDGKKFSRSDHRHPHDSEKMDYMTAITNLELEAMLK